MEIKKNDKDQCICPDCGKIMKELPPITSPLYYCSDNECLFNVSNQQIFEWDKAEGRIHKIKER